MITHRAHNEVRPLRRAIATSLAAAALLGSANAGAYEFQIEGWKATSWR